MCLYVYVKEKKGKIMNWIKTHKAFRKVPDTSECSKLNNYDFYHYYSIMMNSDSIICSIFCQFSCSVVSDSLWPHEPQHTRPPCPSPTPGIYLNPCPPSQWCHPAILSSVVPFSSHLQSFPASGSFWMSQLVASGGQNIGVSASASVLPMNTQDWSPLGWTGWISLQVRGLSRVFSNTTI